MTGRGFVTPHIAATLPLSSHVATAGAPGPTTRLARRALRILLGHRKHWGAAAHYLPFTAKVLICFTDPNHGLSWPMLIVRDMDLVVTGLKEQKLSSGYHKGYTPMNRLQAGYKGGHKRLHGGGRAARWLVPVFAATSRGSWG